MDKKVDFLIIGAQKAGTTSLFQYILQHPDIYFSEVKEVNYFVFDHLYARGERYYHSFFSGYKHQKMIGSAYVHMLPCEKCIERVHRYNANMKFIVILRNPAERAISAYEYAIRNGWEDGSTTIAEAIRLENARLQQEEYDLTYFHNGLYNQHLSRWMSRFPREHFLILKQEDLQHSPAETMNTVFGFLNIGQRKIDTSKKYNVASGVHNKKLQKIMLAKKHPISKILGSILSQQTKVYVRSRIFPIIFRANTSKVREVKVMLTEKERELLHTYFQNDLEELGKNFNIRY